MKLEKSPLNKIHPDLILAEQLAYRPLDLVLENIKIEVESEEYGASEFTINKSLIKFRVGKITPTKVGQFVTFWKRIGNGPIMPYDKDDPFEFLIVSVRADNKVGQFIFPKSVLLEKKIISCDGQGGKRAMRIYPSWDKTDNSQAKKTQGWQLKYFIEFNAMDSVENSLNKFAIAFKGNCSKT